MTETPDTLDAPAAATSATHDTGADADQALADWLTFSACRARIYASAYRVLGRHAEAEDVVQDTFLKWQAADTGHLDVPAAWLTTVATRLAIDRLRRLSTECGWHSKDTHRNETYDVRQTPRDALAFDETSSPEALVEQRSMLKHGIELLLRHLSRDECMALLLHEAFDADYGDIARLAGRTPQHCRQLAHRAKQKLARRIQEAGADARHDMVNTSSPRAGIVEHIVREPTVDADANVTHFSLAKSDVNADWVAPIVDAIARQDRQALLGVFAARAEKAAQAASNTTTAHATQASHRYASLAAADVRAALDTARLLVRLRQGAIRLASRVAA